MGIPRDFEMPSILVQNYALPTIRAAMKLHEDDPAGAVAILQPAVKYELALPIEFSSLLPAYIRGLAYLRMGNGPSAAANFRNCSIIRASLATVWLARYHICNSPGRKE